VLGGMAWLGDITPVSTLMKWFPDGRGKATRQAIMGFCGRNPLSLSLMALFLGTALG
jgi:hypothetical protein